MTGVGDHGAGRHLSRRVLLRQAGLVVVAGAVAGGCATTAAAPVISSDRPSPFVLGDSDQSAVLQGLIDGTPDGGTVELPSGRFRIDRRITISERRNLTVTGPSPQDPFIGYTTLTGLDIGDLTPNRTRRTSFRTHWLVSGGEGVALRNVGVDGPNLERDRGFARFRRDLPFEAAFSVRDSAVRVTLEGCSYQNVYGDGIYIGGTGEPNKDVTVRNVHGSFSGRQGLAVVNVDGMTADRVTCDYAWGVGLDVEPNEGSSVRNASMRELQMGAAHFPFNFGGPGGRESRSNITLDTCTAIRSGSKSAAIWARSPGKMLKVINHNDQRVSSTMGLFLVDWEDILVRNCRIATAEPVAGRAVAVEMDRCSGPVELTDNDFSTFNEMVSGFDDAGSLRRGGNRWRGGEID